MHEAEKIKQIEIDSFFSKEKIFKIFLTVTLHAKKTMPDSQRYIIKGFV